VNKVNKGIKVIGLLMNEIPNTVQNDDLTHCHQVGLLVKTP
jgi:hypothetical protein